MMTMFYKHFEIEITSYINREGNTSYMLDVFDYSRGGVFAYRFIRYQYAGGTRYYMCADADGWCFPCAVRIKDLLLGFNWSCVKREIRHQARMRARFYSGF